MICVQEKTALVNEFSSQVQRHFPEGVWRSLFEQRTGRAHFGTAVRTVLAVECPGSGPLSRDGLVAALARLVRLHGGCVDPCVDDCAFATFSRPEQALRLAIAMQRASGRARLRMGMFTSPCKLARGHADGRDLLILLGAAREKAATLASRAAAGTVQVSPETFEAVGGVVSDEWGSCVVMAEFDDDVLTAVTLTLPPDVTADVSTFAGLGLT